MSERRFTFRAGIRKISVRASTYEEACSLARVGLDAAAARDNVEPPVAWTLELLPEKPLSDAAKHVLWRAITRVDGNVCPTPGLRGVSQTSVLRMLEAYGYVEKLTHPRITVITQAGRAYLDDERNRLAHKRSEQ